MNTWNDRLNQLLAGKPRGTRTAVAKACGVKPSSVTDWANGTTKGITAEHANGIANYFGVTTTWLLFGRGQKTPEDAVGEQAIYARNDREVILLESFRKFTERQQLQKLDDFQSQAKDNEDLVAELTTNR